MLAVFARDVDIITRSLILAEGLKKALYQFLTGHYRQRRGFAALRPDAEHRLEPLYTKEDTGVILLRMRFAYGVPARPTVRPAMRV